MSDNNKVIAILLACSIVFLSLSCYLGFKLFTFYRMENMLNTDKEMAFKFIDVAYNPGSQQEMISKINSLKPYMSFNTFASRFDYNNPEVYDQCIQGFVGKNIKLIHLDSVAEYDPMSGTVKVIALFRLIAITPDNVEASDRYEIVTFNKSGEVIGFKDELI